MGDERWGTNDESCPGTTEDPMHYGHPRMPRSERAKIFMPFDPLKGFRDELRRREQAIEARHVHEMEPPDIP